MKKLSSFAIEKYIERHYDVENMSLQDYVDARESLKDEAIYQSACREQDRWERFYTLVKKRICKKSTSVLEFEQIMDRICLAENDEDIGEILTSYQVI
ncbi:MAG: hypothetical protein J6B29_01575 [Clostridia bacterium]|nr:hypothetical protein [Clostridia bacterium]